MPLLQLLYTTNQAAHGRDTFPAVGHFATPTVANSKVYVATRTSLEAYGLFHVINITGGSTQTATVATALSAPIKVQAANPYNGQPDVGATLTSVTAARAAHSTLPPPSPTPSATPPLSRPFRKKLALTP